MTREQFWECIDSTRPKGMWVALHAGALQIHLETLPPEEIISFERHFQELMAESYRYDLWGAAYIVNGGCSDDGFEYFRAWLISKGHKFYEKCLADPEAVGAKADREGDNEDEEFMYCALEAYREVTGAELPPAGVVRATNPVGEPWKEEELPKLFPRLHKKFGNGPVLGEMF